MKKRKVKQIEKEMSKGQNKKKNSRQLKSGVEQDTSEATDTTK